MFQRSIETTPFGLLTRIDIQSSDCVNLRRILEGDGDNSLTLTENIFETLTKSI